MNKSDAERIASVLEKTGYQETKNEAEADLIVVVSCSVRQKVIDRIFGKAKNFSQLKTINQKLRTILTGCVLPEDKDKLSKYFDITLDIQDLPKLPQLLQSPQFKIEDSDYFHISPSYRSDFQAYLPISTGCNNFCTYCAVPYTRGRETSRPAKEIISQATNLIKRGYKEITLLGQNVNSYGNDNKKEMTFSKLLKKINDIPGNFWIRFITSHPKDFSKELIETIAKGKKITEYIHLPVQSGDDKILRKMNRNYTRKHYLELVKKIREKIKDVAISTDIIVGFPSETKEQFENTKKLMKEVKFDMAYIAQYSPRPGTSAAKLKDNVPPSEKKRREKELLKVLEKTALENNKKYLGKTVEVLVEKESKGYLLAKTRTFKNVKFKGLKKLIGQFRKVKITNCTPWGLKGRLTK